MEIAPLSSRKAVPRTTAQGASTSSPAPAFTTSEPGHPQRHRLPQPRSQRGHLGGRRARVLTPGAVDMWVGTDAREAVMAPELSKLRRMPPGHVAPVQHPADDVDGSDDDPAGLRAWKPKPPVALATLHLLPALAVELNDTGADPMNSLMVQHILENAAASLDVVAQQLAAAGHDVVAVNSYRSSHGRLEVLQLKAERAGGIVTMTREEQPSGGRTAWMGAWHSVPLRPETDAMARAVFGEAPTGAALVGLVMMAARARPTPSSSSAPAVAA